MGDENFEREAFARLREQLAARELRLLRELPPEFRLESPRVQRRLVLLELARAMDDFHGLTIQTGDIDLQKLWSSFYSLGWPKALTLFLDDSTRDPGAPIFSTTPGFHQWALSVLHTCADIAFCEIAMSLCRYDLVALVEATDSRFVFQYCEPRIGLEADERADQEWVRQYIHENSQGAVALLETAEPLVMKALKRNVRRWMQHYLSYDSEPILDDYFAAQGEIYSHQCFGQDLFPDDATFGGKPFRLFRDTVRVLIGWAMKHRAFCGVLLKRHTDLQVRDILTITAELDRLEEDLAAQLEVSSEDARLALEMVTVDARNIGLLKESGPAPMLVTIGDRRVIKSMAGTCTQPYYFMVRALKERFPRDWDCAVDSREKVFREELYALLSRYSLDGLWRPVLIREADRVLTDVDAAVLDEVNGVLGLFQLKWQEPFGHSMRERGNRKRNFVEPSNKWVRVMDEWVGSRSLEDVGVALRLPADVARRLKQVRLFVIAREHSHYSGPNQLDPRAAWGNWFQLHRLLESDPRAETSRSPVEFIWEALRDRTQAGPRKRRLSRQEFQIGDTYVVLEPPGE